MARKLVVSFTGLLYAIERGGITESDLDDALFYFGCTREHAMNPGANGETNELDWAVRKLDLDEAEAKRQRIHGIVTRSLEKAEKDGRAAFRALNVGNSIEQLNGLLSENGFATLTDTDGYYSYPYVEALIEVHGLPLEVVWR